MSDPLNVFHITVRAWPLCSLISDYARLCHNKLANSLRLQYWVNPPFWAYCYIWDAAVHIWTNSAAFTRALARSQRPRANIGIVRYLGLWGDPPTPPGFYIWDQHLP